MRGEPYCAWCNRIGHAATLRCREGYESQFASPAPDPVRMALAAISEACPEPRDPSAYLSPFHAQILDAARLARAALRAPPQSVGNPLGSGKASPQEVQEACAQVADRAAARAAIWPTQQMAVGIAKSIRALIPPVVPAEGEGLQAIDPLHSTSEGK